MTIVGVTDEGKSLTEKFMAANEAHYAYAFDKGGKLSRAFGVRGIPDALLVDPRGEVVWRGHPASLDARTVKKALAGAIARPLFAWPKEAKSVAKALASREFSKALAAAKKMGAGGEEYVSDVEKLIAMNLALVTEARDAGDWLTVDTLGKELSGKLKGLDAGQAIEEILAELKADKEAQAVLKAQKKIVKLTSGKIKSKEIPKLKEQLRKLRDEHPGTYVTKQAEAAIDALTAD